MNLPNAIKETPMKSIFRTIVMVMAGLALAGALAAQEPPKPVDISGVWEVTLQTPQGEMKVDTAFEQKDEVIKVTMTSPMGETKGEGKVKGNEADWTLTVSTPGGEFQLIFKAKIDGDKMAGEVQMGDFGTSAFTAVKKPKV
jgi:hypothetical protein